MMWSQTGYASHSTNTREHVVTGISMPLLIHATNSTRVDQNAMIEKVPSSLRRKRK